jgi:hypothetical protein
MLKLTFNNGYRMANCTMHGEPGTAAAFRHGEAGPGAVRGLWLHRRAWPLALDGDERPREFNWMKFSVMFNGCNRRIAKNTGHHNLLRAHHSREEPAPFHHSRRGKIPPAPLSAKRLRYRYMYHHHSRW